MRKPKTRSARVFLLTCNKERYALEFNGVRFDLVVSDEGTEAALREFSHVADIPNALRSLIKYARDNGLLPLFGYTKTKSVENSIRNADHLVLSRHKNEFTELRVEQ